MKHVRVIGCGSPDAGHDRAGLLAAVALRATLPADVDVRQESAGGVNFDAWCDNADLLVILDAALATPDFPVGTVRRIDYRADPGALQTMKLPSTHVVGVADALRLADQIGILPPDVLIYAIAADRFDLGSDLSESLPRAIDDLVRAVRDEILARLREEPCTSSR